MFNTIDDELKALRRLYKQTDDPIVQLHIIAFGKSINKLLEDGTLIFFDTLDNKENMNKVLENIDYQSMNDWLIKKGYLQPLYND